MNSYLAAILVFLFTHATLQAQYIVAHRGASHDAPENTLAAFKLAWEEGADAIEGDFYLTKDGKIACIHDKTTKRLAPASPELKVADSTLAELQQLDVGSWKASRFAGEKVPTLSDVLATVPPGKKVFVEVKSGIEILPELKKQLEASELKPEQIVIICFNELVVAGCRLNMPQYKVNWLTGYKRKDESSPWSPDQQHVLATLKRTQATGFGTNGNLEVLNAEFVQAVRKSGSELHVWTVNDPEAARQFQKWGFDSITTDRPAVIRAALQ